MRFKRRYKDINDCLREMKNQMKDLPSLLYAEATTPDLKTPQQLWNFLKPKLKYKNDPNEVELLQSYESLMVDNFHGVPGMGDCDCFQIAMTTVGIVRNFDNINLVLAGRSKLAPVHIYGSCYFGGKRYVLDFTEPRFNSERPYPLVQEIKINWKNWNL